MRDYPRFVKGGIASAQSRRDHLGCSGQSRIASQVGCATRSSSSESVTRPDRDPVVSSSALGCSSRPTDWLHRYAPESTGIPSSAWFRSATHRYERSRDGNRPGLGSRNRPTKVNHRQHRQHRQHANTGPEEHFPRAPLGQKRAFQLNIVGLRALTMLTIFVGPVKPMSPILCVCPAGPHD